MKTFTDNRNRDWIVEINVETVRRVRAMCDGTDLLAAVGGDLLEKLSADPVLLADVLYAVCQPQAEKASVTAGDFGAALAGDAIDRATTCLLQEIADFFPKGRRQILTKILGKMKEVEEAAVRAVEVRIESGEFDRLIQQTLNASVGNLPESSVSIPDP